MAERERLFLPFGDGLSRADGVMVTEPTKFEDLRNVILWRGKAEVRKGYERSTILVQEDNVTPCETVCSLGPIRAESGAMGIGYTPGNKRVHANLMGIDGTNAVHIPSGLANGEIFTLPTGATFDPPVIHQADTYNKNFIAHDEPVLGFRAQTAYYDPNASPQIQFLEADLDGLGDNPVYFRGVMRYLSYLVGWGFGSDSEPDRPDVVRVSIAGEPLNWDARHYFFAGQRNEPVMTCQPAGNVLLVLKETELHEIFGYSPRTFGIRPADRLYGTVGSRLAITVSGTCFFWSVQGPRMSAGGESQDLAMPLDIGGPDPATLVAESDPEEAFADYDAVNRVVMFVWGRRVYALSLREPSRPRWSYYELGASAEPFCSAQFYATQATGGGGTAPTGWPRVGGAAVGPPAPVMGDTTMDIEWYNNLANGSEVVEIWLKDVDGTGTWSKYAQPSVDLSAGGPNFEQTYQITGLMALHEYEISLRYKAAGQFSPGMTSSDPAAWNDPTCPACPEDPPAYVATLYTTGSAPIFVDEYGTRGNNGLWARTGAATEQITIQWTNPAGHSALQIEIQRERSTVGNTGTQNIDGMGPPDSVDQVVEAMVQIEASYAAGSTSYVDTAVTGEQLHEYRMRYLAPGAAPDGPWTAPTLHSCFAGPDPPISGSLLLNCNPTQNYAQTQWQNAITPAAARVCPAGVPPAAHSTQNWGKNVTQASAWGFDSTFAPYQTNGGVTFTGANDGDTVRISVRHRTSCSGVYDYSRWFLPGYDSCIVGATE